MRRGWGYIDYSCDDETGYLCSPVVTTRSMVSTTLGLILHTRGRLEDVCKSVIWKVHHEDLSGLSYKKLTTGMKYTTSHSRLTARAVPRSAHVIYCRPQ